MAKEFYPTIEELRESQREGSKDEGMNETDCTDLNAVQGHKADIREHIDGMAAAKDIREGMTAGNQPGNMDHLDRTDRADWPEAEEI